MIGKILSSKTPFEVLGIIDRKVKLMKTKINNKMMIHHFIESSLDKLNHIHRTRIKGNNLHYKSCYQPFTKFGFTSHLF